MDTTLSSDTLNRQLDNTATETEVKKNTQDCTIRDNVNNSVTKSAHIVINSLYIQDHNLGPVKKITG